MVDVRRGGTVFKRGGMGIGSDTNPPTESLPDSVQIRAETLPDIIVVKVHGHEYVLKAKDVKAVGRPG
jgi:hypothetical protein